MMLRTRKLGSKRQKPFWEMCQNEKIFKGLTYKHLELMKQNNHLLEVVNTHQQTGELSTNNSMQVCCHHTLEGAGRWVVNPQQQAGVLSIHICWQVSCQPTSADRWVVNPQQAAGKLFTINSRQVSYERTKVVRRAVRTMLERADKNVIHDKLLPSMIN